MIDIENEILTVHNTNLRAAFGDTFPLYGISSIVPATFPCAFVEQTQNAALRETRDTSTTEHDAEVTYEVRTFSNRAQGAKEEAKAVMRIIDDGFRGLNFTRTSCMPVPSGLNGVYCLFARYTAVVSQNKTIYRR